MAGGGRRDEVDAKITGWEKDLERLRVALAGAPESVHDAHHQHFTDLYRCKEVVKSRWELVRGVYRPDPTAVQRFEEALAAMEAAWEKAQPMLAGVPALRAA